MPTPAEKRKIFRKLHESGCFVIPNPWSPGTARYLEGLGFKALASTSSGYAHSQGYADGALTRDQVLTHYREIASTVSVPVNADFENGFAHKPEDVAANVKLCIETGVAGLSIEDYTNDDASPLYDFDLAVARVKAARQAVDQMGGDVLLTGRAEGFLHGKPDLADAIKRLKAFSEAGADCLYAPGIVERADIRGVVAAVAPKPVNVLLRAPPMSVADLAALGVRRVSVGGRLAAAAWLGFDAALKELHDQGTLPAVLFR
jgi:2-methylisocitrate lyase-like PEP mutase family enzyme